MNQVLSWRRVGNEDAADGGRPRQHTSIALVIILAALATLWLCGSFQDFLLCDMECGETLLAVNAADQFAAHGIQHGLLENLGTYEQPVLYTHNVNIGDLAFTALEALGVRSFTLKTLAPLIVFGVGLYYIYRMALLFSNSALCALLILSAFSATYWGFGAFSLNPLRAWHGLAFFMICFHVGRWRERRIGARSDISGICIAALIAFGCGYDFWVICGAVAASMVLLNTPWTEGWRPVVFRLGVIGTSFALPFILRQLQIVYALGAAYWWQDVLFTLAIKIPGASRYILIPPMSEIDAFYTARHILRPPATPSNDWRQILDTGRHMVETVTIPRWGIITLLTYCLMVIVGLLGRLRLFPRIVRPQPAILSLTGYLLIPMTIGMMIGLAAFAPFSLHVYLKHEFPLIGFLLMLARGIALYWAASLAWSYWKTAFGYAAATVFALLVVDAGMVHLNASLSGLYPNFKFRYFVQGHPEARFLLSTLQQIPVADRLLGLPRDRVEYADAANARDTLAMLERPRDQGTPPLPDFWIYQPMDEKVDFDSTRPTCKWGDWLLQEIERLNLTGDSSPIISAPWVAPQSTGLGGTVNFGGKVGNLRRTDTLQVTAPPSLAQTGALAYNCIYGTLVAWVTAVQATPAVQTISLSARRNNEEIHLQDFAVHIDPEARPAAPVVPFKPDEPSVSTMITLAKGLTVVDRDDSGIGYVIFAVPKKEKQ